MVAISYDRWQILDATRTTYNGRKVAELIEFRGLRHRWVAEQLDVHYSYLSKLLSGDKPITDDIARRLSVILAVPTSFFTEEPVNGKAA